MNEFNETPKETRDVSKVSEVKETKAEYSSLREVWKNFTNSIREFFDSDTEVREMHREFMEAREYGVSECADVAKGCFTPEVISEWGIMSYEERDSVIQEYAVGIGEALDITFKGVIWENMPYEYGSYTYGYNCGDGYIHLNADLLADPGQLIQLVDTVAHEARHQMQAEAVENPERFPFDEATIKEWKVGFEVYTTEMPNAYDPWGYTYNPTEVDARFFGESMVRELTKDIINNA